MGMTNTCCADVLKQLFMDYYKTSKIRGNGKSMLAAAYVDLYAEAVDHAIDVLKKTPDKEVK